MLVKDLTGLLCPTCGGAGGAPDVDHPERNIPCRDCRGAGRFEEGPAGPAVLIGGKVYPSTYSAAHQFRTARAAARNPLHKLLCLAVLVELGGMR